MVSSIPSAAFTDVASMASIGSAILSDTNFPAPSILDLVGAFKSGEHTAAAALESLRVHYVAPLVKADGTVDRKAADFLEVREQCEAALVADFAATTRTVGGVRIEPGSDLHKRIPDLFALSKGVMKTTSKVDPDWIVATAVKNAVRRDWNRIVKACLPKSTATVGESDTADAAHGAGTKASEKATSPVATTPEAVLAAIQNCAASMPDVPSADTFLQSAEVLIKRLRGDLKAKRKILHCEV
jgi:hypothetical protein